MYADITMLYSFNVHMYWINIDFTRELINDDNWDIVFQFWDVWGMKIHTLIALENQFCSDFSREKVAVI